MACTCQPGKGLCASCLTPIYERNKVAPGPLDNGNGEYTLAQVELFEKKFTDSIVEDVRNNNPLKNMVNRYPDFYDSVAQINNDFMNREYVKEQLPDYKVLDSRLQQGPITALEWASFMENSNYTPATAIKSGNAKGSRFLDELNSYYNGDFSDSILGGFCGLFNNIFGAINSFFDILNKIDGFIQDVFTFLKKIKNIKNEILAAFEAIKVKAIIEAIKEKISEMVKAAILKVCQSISNFDVSAIIGTNIPNPSPAQVQAAKDGEEKKSALSSVCGEENAELIKEKIQSIINYAVGLFENPSIEEIFMLISRLCGMAAGIEGVFKKLKDPLNDFANRYDEVFNTLSNASNRVTGEAIRAGGIRATEEGRQELINNARRVWSGLPPNAPDGARPTNRNMIPPTVEEIAGVPSWEDIKDNRHPLIRIQGGWTIRMQNKHEGWTKLTPDIRIAIMRLQKAAVDEGVFSGPIILNSGYRNPVYNERVDGATSSQHLSGKAADLTWNGFRNRGRKLDTFQDLARSFGFRGFGFYNSFFHCDMGPARTWDKR